jgi:hypothetical protein
MSKASITTYSIAAFLGVIGLWAVGSSISMFYNQKYTSFQEGGKKHSKSRKSIIKNTKKTRKQK